MAYIMVLAGFALGCPLALAERPSQHAEAARGSPMSNVLDFSKYALDVEEGHDNTALAFDGKGLGAFKRVDTKDQKLPSTATASLVQLHQSSAAPGPTNEAEEKTTATGGEGTAGQEASTAANTAAGSGGPDGYVNGVAPSAPTAVAFKGDVDTAAASTPTGPDGAAITDKHKDITGEGVSLDYKTYKSDYENHQKAKLAHYQKELAAAATKNKMAKNAQYTDFVSHVLAVDPGHVKQVVEDAKNAVDANHLANQDAYEYVDDLSKLASGTSVGYNRMGLDHFYAYDQIRAQLKEGHMVPGQSIKLLFPLAGNVAFKPNSNVLYDESKQYFHTTFANTVKEKLAKYRGYHFTICIHASTNLGPGSFPHKYNSKEQQQLVNGVSVGAAQMLDERSAAIQQEVQGMMKTTMEGMNIRDEEFMPFPAPSEDSRHFGGDKNAKLFPAGAVLIVAEDRLHRDGYKPKEGQTQSDVEKELAKSGKHLATAGDAAHDKKICTIDDFNEIRSKDDYKEYAMGKESQDVLKTLPQSSQENGAESNEGRPSSQEVQNYVKEHKLKMKATYDEATAEAAKYTEAMKNLHGK